MNESRQTDPDRSLYADAWPLDPQVAMLNHGSFGACPKPVLDVQAALRDELEQGPIRFLMRRMEPLLDASRQTLAELVGADSSDLVFVRNATEGVNSVLRSLRFGPADELLVTDHEYNACRNALDFVAGRSGAKVVVAAVPTPIESEDQIVDAVLGRVTERTRLALLDHVTSPTAVVFPVERLIPELDARGVETLVDGAHAPGMIPLDLDRLGAAYYTGNCHKWLCAPKGAGLLHVRADCHEGIHPAVISHGLNTRRADRPRLHDEFDWTGTDDPTAWLSVGVAIRFLDGLVDGGIEGLMHRNRRLALESRRMLSERLRLPLLCPDAMIGSIAALRLPEESAVASRPIHPLQPHPMQTALFEQFGIEVPVYHWPAAPHRLLRISAQAYNYPSQYERLADALAILLRA